MIVNILCRPESHDPGLGTSLGGNQTVDSDRTIDRIGVGSLLTLCQWLGGKVTSGGSELRMTEFSISGSKTARHMVVAVELLGDCCWLVGFRQRKSSDVAGEPGL